VTTHGWQERYDTCELVKSARMELCCGGIVGMGETLAQRAELASELAGLGPDEVPLNFLNPRPGTPLGGINAIIVGNYLTTLGRPAEADLEMLGRLRMPIKALTGTV
jgi:biotin synthase